MAASRCDREADTIRAAWGVGPEADPELAAHLAACRDCADIIVLARALREDRHAACAAARPPAAGIVWWRAQRRAREEAARKAARPIVLVHAVALGCAGAAALALLSLAPSAIDPRLVLPLAGGAWDILLAAAWRTTMAWPPLGAAFLLASSLVLTPVAIYFALSD